MENGVAVPLPDAAAIASVFREQYGRAVSVLYRVFGDLDRAEDAVQDAFAVAAERWPRDGIPPAPAGWIITTARRRAIDRLRRDAVGREKEAEAMLLRQLTGDGRADSADAADAIADDRLRLVFTCCHPALSPEARVALTLRLLGGLTTAEIARAFLVPEPTMAQRISRAKAKVRDARIPYRIPSADDLPARLRSVLAVVYLVFSEGYAASAGDRLVREELCTEAIRLARELRSLLPDEEEVLGLLALLLLVDARRAARVDAAGALIPLPEQDRSGWNAEQIAEGHELVRLCLARGRPGPYQLQAAIQAVHDDASTASETDWPQIVALYDQLLRASPTPVVALNRAVAVAEVEGEDAGLAALEPLREPLAGFYLLHGVRAGLLLRAGRTAEAADEYAVAASLCGGDAERAFLLARQDALTRRS
ncbi:RNA polymerase, sigma subunit, ECF family [Leifsonia sp. 98AMF]|uniref:RNA polymerase sigma factor n=1 Tax=unclassified Leifsonia TaxID=2663824 RepID=UPI00087B7348|nr:MULTISPECIES: sigma-70 family RNA polymerase sigma factor [unclassified Leifsonia]SDH28421.1 RNA polymerase, sigma subunit, ECF family [Leifsonia sp. 197AMF]SDJ09874.1 RNA polymerase, sigma subunit, ECF family [Leifsonia sp. 466MF]SDJ60637.1 RNA polymerase, sigma subunit, ECF family [Leifsonia sp. 157MF]SDN31120.1 RNA polymerase, sigma subunit, ECF family [Leifsonia sp. 509MF]SEM90187.1 RNA polymerase, sigma subunit, ECF family [Leifsonia sp. 467MF]